MRIFAAVLCCSLAVLAVNSAQHEDDEPTVGDTLQKALNAVSRRQLQIVDNEPTYFGLNSYRYPKEDADGMPFLSDDAGFNEDGQPENIGYGFQKSVAGGVSPGVYASQFPSETDDALLTELALEYLDAEMKNDNEEQFYPSVNDAEKRSVFREREMPESGGRSAGSARKLEDMRKRGGPSSFRERAHDGDENENQRHRLAESVIRRMEEEREEAEAEAEDDDQEYEKLIENLLERYGGSSRNEVDVGKLSTKELGELLEFLGENGASMADIEGVRAAVAKRYGGGNGYGAGYDFFNNGATMNGGFGYKKRSKQQLDDADAAENAFLFSLKFVSPELNRETVEQMRENEGIDPSSENDYDISKLSMRYLDEEEKARAEGWLPVNEEQEHEEYENLENPQNLMRSREVSRKRNKQVKHHNIPAEYVLPERHIDKKFLYDRALMKRKRFPVSKRSSNYYTSPPLLHHHVDGERKKKDAPDSHGTDPKVASEISQIFSSQTADDHPNDNVKIAPQIIGNHVVTKQKAMPSAAVRVVPTSSTTTTTTAETNPGRYEQHTQTVIEDRPNDEEIELPVTMSRLEIPIEVKKKSIDWSDYFGLDRRRKKTGPKDSLPSNAVDKDWLLNQYYKTLALSANPNKRVSLYRSNNEMKYKKTMPVQPFDTRIFDADIFQRNEAKKSRISEGEDTRIENMDSKLSNLEDLIVNEALKYTGAHQGTSDSREIQEVKDKVMTRLAAAYNLEKMRRALGEFKSSLTAQKMSKYNPMEQRKGGELDDKRKRVAVKKEGAEGRNEKDKKNGKKRSEEYNPGFAPPGNEGGFGEIIDGPVIEAMSEGYMGGPDNRVVLDPGECPILANIAKKCQSRVAEHEQSLLPLCALHQICYICGAEGDSQSPAACDSMFAKKAEEVCAGSAQCGDTAIRVIVELTGRMPMDVLYGMPTECWDSFCSAQLMTPPKQV